MSNGSAGVPTCTELKSVIEPAWLSYHLLRPSRRDSADPCIRIEAYRVWSEVWRQTFFELEKIHSVPSDNFSRQDEIGALFHGSECIGLTAYRWVDTADPIDMDDSYFAVWPREALHAAAAFGTRVCIFSNLAVAPAWRGNGGLVKELLGALAMERFLSSDADTCISTTRNDRSINALCYRGGLTSLARGVIYHGVPVDLVAFYRSVSIWPPLPRQVEAILHTLARYPRRPRRPPQAGIKARNDDE